jgi:protein O-GlcNAc transferase
LSYMMLAMCYVCDWDDYHKVYKMLERATRAELKKGELPAAQPSEVYYYPMDPQLNLQVTKAYAEQYEERVAQMDELPPAAAAGNRLRIAYISYDFNLHPVGMLIGSVFSLHDRSRFEVFAYATSASDGSPMRSRIERDAEHFLDVSKWSYSEIAKRINADGINIAIDLTGYTKGLRPEVFAMRCAPVQIEFLGFAATTGADFFDYNVVDDIVAPPELHRIYSESLILMPITCMITDHKQANRNLLTAPPLSRSEVGLPERGIIFVSVNGMQKCNPETFDTWCRILKRVPGSVLWLRRPQGKGEDRLRSFAIKNGVDASRLYFSGATGDFTEYLRRLSMCDVYLDTPMYNCCTVACDVLWAGLPLVTMPEERYTSRLASSVCRAAGFGDEMVTYSLKAYEDLAVELATNDAKRTALRQRLQAARETCPLFDTRLFMRDWEQALSFAWQKYESGEEPTTFSVADLA